MKSFVIALSIILIFIIGSNAVSSSNNTLSKERRESYQACIRLRTKAPNLNLKCENLIANFHSAEQIKRDVAKNGIKFLENDVTGTRKVNKSEEKKLRNFIRKMIIEKEKKNRLNE